MHQTIYQIDALTNRAFKGNPAAQASARGGVVRVRLLGDQVKLGGQAVTVMCGELV